MSTSLQVADWFGMAELPRTSVRLSRGRWAVVARDRDRIRVATGRPVGDRVKGDYHSLTERQARQLRDALSAALETS